VSITILDARGEPLSTGNVWIGDARADVGYGHATVDSGRAVVEAMPPGKWQVKAGNSDPADIEVQSGVTTQIELREPR